MKVIRKIKQRIDERRNPKPVDQLDVCACENCGHTFQGYFCPNCGQEVAEFNRPFGFILYDIFGNFFAFDTRLFTTFKLLLFRPGFITSEFFKGRRARYSPPIRILVFLSFILFFLLQTLSDRALEKLPDQAYIGLKSQGDSVNSHSSDSLSVSLNPLQASVEKENDFALFSDPEQGKDNVVVTFDGNLRNNLQAIADQYEVTLVKTEDPKRRKELKSFIAMCRMPELLISKVLELLSWAFFALVPLLALILELFYLKQGQRYIKHLIFSAHFHSFQFLVLIFISVLALLFSSGIAWIVFLLLLSIPVYLFLAMKRFYGQRNKFVILKFLCVSALYQLTLFSMMIAVLAQTFGVG